MRFMQIELVLQTKNRSEPAKNRFSIALVDSIIYIHDILILFARYINFDRLQITFLDVVERRASNLFIVGQ